MARQTRRTVPLDSKVGPLETFAEQEPELIAAEWRGRAWVFEQASQGIHPSDYGIFDLHRVMFEPLLEWAGEPRKKDAGPSGIVNVSFARVREEMRKFTGDFDVWREDLGLDPTLGEIANLVADAHHRFQWIHPFEDTNGRTGRVLDHWVLWSTFALRATIIEESPVVEYFEVLTDEDEYYGGLLEADLKRPERLRNYYAKRIERALAPVFTVHWWNGSNHFECSAIHDTLTAAVDDMLEQSKVDPGHRFMIRGEGGLPIIYAFGGKLIDAAGCEVPRPPP